MKFHCLRWLSILIISFGGCQFSYAGGWDLSKVKMSDTTNQIIIKLNTYLGSEEEVGISEEQMAQLEEKTEVSLKRFRRMSGEARVLSLAGEMSIIKLKVILKRLKQLDFVKHAEADRRMFTMAVTPNDPMYTSQWNFFEPVGGINLPNAWMLTTGDPDVVVGVIDTGILGNHEDHAGRWGGGYDFIDMRFNARDRDGRDPDPRDQGDWTRTADSSWHGTHVAGTIGAATDNNAGVAGIDWECQILPIRVLGRFGGFTSDIVDGMRWSAGISIPDIPDNPTPANVINMSLGGGGSCSSIWQEAVDDVVNAGTSVVVAAGNSNQDASNATPASCDGVITVGATNRSGDRAWYSNYGSNVEISAPGGETMVGTDGILSTLNTGLKRPVDDAYAFYQGTSMAAPHVAGVIALMYAINPNLTPEQIANIITGTSRLFPAGTDCDNIPDLCGAGILDAAAAVNFLVSQ